MKTYTIVGGVNGCGKSSLTGVLKSLEPNMGIIIDPDDIAKKAISVLTEWDEKPLKRYRDVSLKILALHKKQLLQGDIHKKLLNRPNHKIII